MYESGSRGNSHRIQPNAYGSINWATFPCKQQIVGELRCYASDKLDRQEVAYHELTFPGNHTMTAV